MRNIDTSSWKEFRLDELFESESGDFDIKKEHINGLGYDVVTAGETNNGILGRSDVDAKIFSGNTITIDMFGKCVYRPNAYKMVTHARVFSLKCKYNEMTENAGLFLSTMLQKLANGFNYSNMCSWNKIKDLPVKLPVTVSEEIDWDYMQERIKELEQERIKELEQYLITTGLNDYELTDKDKKILATKLVDGGPSQSSTTGSGLLKEAREFRVVDVFNVKNSNNILKSMVDYSGELHPYVTAQECDNSIMAYVSYDRQYLDNGNCIFIGGKTLTISYQEVDFFSNDSHNLLLYSKDNIPKLSYMYLISALYKSLKPKYNWNNSISSKKIQKDIFCLPIKCDRSNNPFIDANCKYHPEGFIPDWDFMENYIKAIEKVVIRDVVDWKDREIEAMRNVVE